MTALKKVDGVKKKLLMSQEQGAAFLLAVVASAVLLMVGTAFAMLIANEGKSLKRQTAYDQALYVAESGIEDVLYQRAKQQGDKCFPFKATTEIESISINTEDIAGAAGAMINGTSAACDSDPNTDADMSDGGYTMDSPIGSLCMHTFRKLPTTRPNMAKNVSGIPNK